MINKTKKDILDYQPLLKIKPKVGLDLPSSILVGKNKTGFTLIELLVSIGIISLIILASTTLFFTSLKAKKKNSSLTTIKQSGDYALSIMNMMIRNAKDLNCSPPNEITITNPDGETTTFSCQGHFHGCPSGISSERIASHSASASRDDCLTADNIGLLSCSFSCSQEIGSPSIVTVAFTLSKGNPDDILSYASQEFKTTISLRNY